MSGWMDGGMEGWRDGGREGGRKEGRENVCVCGRGRVDGLDSV